MNSSLKVYFAITLFVPATNVADSNFTYTIVRMIQSKNNLNGRGRGGSLIITSIDRKGDFIYFVIFKHEL